MTEDLTHSTHALFYFRNNKDLSTSPNNMDEQFKILQSIGVLQKPNIRIRDPARTEKVLQKLIQDGKQKLQVVADFDYTLTKFSHQGEMCPCTFATLEQSGLLPDFYNKEAFELFKFYYPIETSHEMTTEEKIPHMQQWWTKAQALLVRCNFKKDLIPKMIKRSKARLRDGCSTLFKILHKNDIPLLIFSAGIGDVILELIKEKDVFYDNMKVVSNFINFNEQDLCQGFKGNMIHVFNKNENAIHGSDYFENLSHRSNIVLMGDSLGDLHMADGASDTSGGQEPCKLTIGFLNTNVEERIDQYQAQYDIVVISDETMDVCNAILQKIL